MAIQHTAEISGKLLHATASGAGGSLPEMLEYRRSVLEESAAGDCTHILFDERQLTRGLSTFDTFEYAKSMAENARHAFKVALVCAPSRLDMGKFWETVAVNRGLRARAFVEISEARSWLDVDSDSNVSAESI